MNGHKWLKESRVEHVKISDSDAENGAQVETALMQKLTLSESQSDCDYDDSASDISDLDFDNNYFQSDHEEDVAEPDPDQAFPKEHPLYEIHIIQYDSRKNGTVPNFVGLTLGSRNLTTANPYHVLETFSTLSLGS